jgi:hypothetical protein
MLAHMYSMHSSLPLNSGVTPGPNFGYFNCWCQFKILTNFNNLKERVAKKVHLVYLSSFELSNLVKILNW